MNESSPQQQLHKLIEMSEDLFAISTLKGELLHLKPAWEWTLGYPLEHLKSTPMLDFVHPEDIESTQEVLSSLGNGSRVTQFANRHRHQEGHWVWLRWNAVPDVEEGMVYAVARDVTDFTHAREQIAEFVTALRSGSALVQAALNHAEVLTQQLREQHYQIMALIDDPRAA